MTSYTSVMSPAPLRRDQRVLHVPEQIDADLYRRFNLRPAVCEWQLQACVTLPLELRAFATGLEAADATHRRDYEEELREKTRVLGRPVPLLDTPFILCGEPEGAS